VLQSLAKKGYHEVCIGDVAYLIDELLASENEFFKKNVHYMEFRLWVEIYADDDYDNPIAIVRIWHDIPRRSSSVDYELLGASILAICLLGYLIYALLKAEEL
jgi:K+-transporting ATPase KdpF subunit